MTIEEFNNHNFKIGELIVETYSNKMFIYAGLDEATNSPMSTIVADSYGYFNLHQSKPGCGSLDGSTNYCRASEFELLLFKAILLKNGYEYDETTYSVKKAEHLNDFYIGEFIKRRDNTESKKMVFAVTSAGYFCSDFKMLSFDDAKYYAEFNPHIQVKPSVLNSFAEDNQSYSTGLRDMFSLMKRLTSPQPRKITFLLNKDDSAENVCSTVLETQKAINERQTNIVTYDLSYLSFDMLTLGYEIEVVNGEHKISMYPGMETAHQKEIKFGHNIRRMLMGGYFNDDLDVNFGGPMKEN